MDEFVQNINFVLIALNMTRRLYPYYPYFLALQEKWSLQDQAIMCGLAQLNAGDPQVLWNPVLHFHSNMFFHEAQGHKRKAVVWQDFRLLQGCCAANKLHHVTSAPLSLPVGKSMAIGYLPLLLCVHARWQYTWSLYIIVEPHKHS